MGIQPRKALNQAILPEIRPYRALAYRLLTFRLRFLPGRPACRHFSNPFSSVVRLMKGCLCGRHASAAEHDKASSLKLWMPHPPARTAASAGVVENAVMRAIFPVDAERRAFLKAVGASTAGRLGHDLPRLARRPMSGAGRADRKEGSQGRVHPDTCATPIHIMAHPWASIRSRAQCRSDQDGGLGGDPRQTLNKEYDAAHMLAPMPLAISSASARTRRPSRCRRWRTSTARPSPWP